MKNQFVNNHKVVTRTWLSGQNSCTLVIPKAIAKEHGINNPSHVVIESKPEGILIKKLQF